MLKAIREFVQNRAWWSTTGPGKDYKYYLAGLTGGWRQFEHLFSEYPEEQRERLVLTFCFDKIEELGDSRVCVDLEKYVDDQLDDNPILKGGAIATLGLLGDIKYEGKIYQYLKSKNDNLRNVAFYSMCQLLKRNELSEEVSDLFTRQVASVFTEKHIGNEKLLLCALTLKAIDYPNIDRIVDEAHSAGASFRYEYETHLPSEKPWWDK